MNDSKTNSEQVAEVEALRKQVLDESVLKGIIEVLKDCEVLDGETVSYAEADIMKWADDPSSTGFTEALRFYHESVKKVEHLEALRHSVEAALDAIHNAGTR